VYWLKFANDDGTSGSNTEIDPLSAGNGSEINQTWLYNNSPSNGDDQGKNFDTGKVNHSNNPPFGQDNFYIEDPEKNDVSKSNVEEMPVPINEKDDNHADGFNSIAYYFLKGSNNADFYDDVDNKDNTGFPSDRTRYELKDGITSEEWTKPQSVINNYISQPSGSAKELLYDGDDFDDSGQQLTNRASSELNGSNVEDIMHPDEIENVEEAKGHDFFDEGRTQTRLDTQVWSPLNQNLGLAEEDLYSGRCNATLYNAFWNEFNKIAINMGEMPNVNPNSGADEEYDNKHQMTDGKDYTKDSRNSDKINYDPYKAFTKILRPEGKTEDTDDYWSFINSGGGYGNSADGTLSGVNPI